MAAVDRIQAEVSLSCSVAHAWTVFVHEKGQWWPEMDFWPVAGSLLTEHWELDGVSFQATGVVEDVVEGRRLVFSWCEGDWERPTTVECTFDSDGMGARICLSESGFAALSDGESLAADHRVGWAYHLQTLKQHVDETTAPHGTGERQSTEGVPGQPSQ